MADEFQAGVCGGNWWNSSRSIIGSSLCASSVPIGNSNFAWSNDLLNMKSSCRSNDESGNSDESVVLQELPKHDSTLHMLGIGLSSSTSSPTPDWNHTLIHGNERADSYPSILQEDLNNSSLNYQQETGVDCSSNSFKQDFTLGMNHPITSSTNTDQSTVISSTFPMSSSFSSYPSVLQTLFDNDPPPPSHPQQQPQLQQSFFINNNQQPMNFPSSSLNYRPDLNDFSPSLPKFPSLLRPSSALPKQTPSNNFPYSNAPSLYNTSSATCLNNMRGNLLPSMHQQLLQSPTFNRKSSVPNVTAKSNVEELRESRSSSSQAKKSGNNEPTLKKARIETPSPLPTFKVRKEKLGDRITALQQLVSPFGKTDTASVLHEAIEYIKFLHDQVNLLSTPYLKNGSTPQHQQTVDKVTDQEGSKQDMRSRGLCLVPISSTFPVATETTTDFWTPNFSGTFR
ncbi:transcription factor bHLH112-like [Lycium ferocissimum]|uniref:transcription factor bHLH112-like n=1 Tax=Lycium ferocissimum TaxID=112874 RepID=UPI002814B542|nr:transcription factor bHLH112-like [Lycium ferocissimum]